MNQKQNLEYFGAVSLQLESKEDFLNQKTKCEGLISLTFKLRMSVNQKMTI